MKISLLGKESRFAMTTIQSTASGTGDKASESKRKRTLVERKLVERCWVSRRLGTTMNYQFVKGFLLFAAAGRHLIRRRTISNTSNVSVRMRMRFRINTWKRQVRIASRNELRAKTSPCKRTWHLGVSVAPLFLQCSEWHTVTNSECGGISCTVPPLVGADSTVVGILQRSPASSQILGEQVQDGCVS